MTKKQNQWLTFRKKYLKGKMNHEGYYICEACGAWTKEPELHHIKTRGSSPHLILEESNLILLCFSCHKLRHQ
jgi:5-methylcytosine-specific restriction endonuclease McrA